jgi:SAM-dependent methyltransferase
LHPLLLPLAGSLAGADISTDSLARAKNENPAVEYRPIAGALLPWPQQSFDATLAVSVVHHVKAAERARLIGEMRRVTRAGGLVVVIEHNPWNPLTRLAVMRCPFDADAELLGARRARRMLESCGLNSVKSRHFLVFPPQIQAPRLERALARIPLGAQYAAIGEA